MRSYSVTCDSTATPTFSPWLRLNHYMWDYSIGFRAQPATGTTGTYSIQESLSNPEQFVMCNFSRSTTTLTLTYTNHGLVVGDGVFLQGTPWDTTNGQSIAVATVADANTMTLTVANTGATAGALAACFIRINTDSNYSAVSDVQTGSTTGGMQLIRVAKLTGTLSGRVTLEVTQSGY